MRRGCAPAPWSSDWIDAPPPDPIAHRPDVAGARITAWLGHYDFFAATADDAFRQRLMARLVVRRARACPPRCRPRNSTPAR